MAELVDRGTPWHRSLWQVGSILALREVLEYAESTRKGTMRPEGLQHVCSSAATSIARDLGVPDSPAKDTVLELLGRSSKKDGVVDPGAADTLTELVRRIERDYLTNWARGLTDNGVGVENSELTARALVSHMLDAGFSVDHLHGWLLATKADTKLADLIAQADDMFRRPFAKYTVMVPFATLPPEVVAQANERFMDWGTMLDYLNKENLPKPPASLREGPGALTFDVEAREPRAAIEQVGIELRRLGARVTVGLTSKTVTPAGHALVFPASTPKWKPLGSWQKDIMVSAIVRHRLLVPSGGGAPSALDDAFELLASVQTATSWASVATLWAAVEGLLARAGDAGAIAADRLAAVVAGGFVRAELTQLVDVARSRETELGGLLRSMESAPAAMDALLTHLANGDDLGLNDPTDAAGVARIRQVLNNPAEVMARIKGYFCDAFRRLYSQRNLMLHGGRFDSVALPATMRTVPPLVAAGLDRLVHAELQVPRTDPFRLAARAENELAMLGHNDARSMHRLLD